jgi:ElaB/YqjD/DUF883 family membrane-anchored ribosome-binding protein
VDAQAPEEIYALLATEVLLHPAMKQLSEQILFIKGRDFFLRRFENSIKRFCRNLSAENSNLFQKGAIQILRRRYRYFAYWVTCLLDQTTSQAGDTLANLRAQAPKIVGKVEKYLQTLNIHTSSNQEERLSTTHSYTEPKPTFQGEEKSYRQRVTEISINADSGDADPGSSEDEHEGTDEDGEGINFPPLHLTKETISWIVESVAFRNFISDLTRVLSPPMQYVEKVLRFALSPSFSSTASFHLPWNVVDYAQTQLENIQQLCTILTLSGDAHHAEASTCLDYCERVWPLEGPAVVKALQNAIANTSRGKYYSQTSETGLINQIVIYLLEHCCLSSSKQPRYLRKP